MRVCRLCDACHDEFRCDSDAVIRDLYAKIKKLEGELVVAKKYLRAANQREAKAAR